MQKLRIQGGWILFMICAVLFAALAFMPLRFALANGWTKKAGISAKIAQGNVWDGAVADLRVGALSIGYVNTGLRVLPLLTGSAVYDVNRDPMPAQPGFSAVVNKGWGTAAIGQVTGTANYQSAGSDLPISAAEFRNFSVAFGSAGCRNAGGSVRLLLKSGAIPGVNLDGGLLGNAKCKGGALFLPLVSSSAMERADVTLKSDGSFSVAMTIINPEAQTAALLSVAGFQPISGGLKKVLNGRL
jgi:general secretion pathway protein N